MTQASAGFKQRSIVGAALQREALVGAREQVMSCLWGALARVTQL